jgi:hypothetical protein
VQQPILWLVTTVKKCSCFFKIPLGNFLVKFSDVEKLAESNITPMHETEGAEKMPVLQFVSWKLPGVMES